MAFIVCYNCLSTKEQTISFYVLENNGMAKNNYARKSWLTLLTQCSSHTNRKRLRFKAIKRLIRISKETTRENIVKQMNAKNEEERRNEKKNKN